MSVDTFEKWPAVVMQCLHECVVMESPGEFRQVLMVKDVTNKKHVEKLVKERTTIAGVRDLNRSATKLGSAGPDWHWFSQRNRKVRTLFLGLRSNMLTTNSDCNNSKELCGRLFNTPKSACDCLHDHAASIANSKYLASNIDGLKLAFYSDFKIVFR